MASMVVTGVRVEIDGRVTEGVLRKREQARADYDDAISSGRKAVELEETESGGLALSVGVLKPSQRAKVTISYVCELSYENGCLRFLFPVSGKCAIQGSSSEGGSYLSGNVTFIAGDARVKTIECFSHKAEIRQELNEGVVSIPKTPLPCSDVEVNVYIDDLVSKPLVTARLSAENELAVTVSIVASIPGAHENESFIVCFFPCTKSARLLENSILKTITNNDTL